MACTFQHIGLQGAELFVGGGGGGGGGTFTIFGLAGGVFLGGAPPPPPPVKTGIQQGPQSLGWPNKTIIYQMRAYLPGITHNNS